MFEEQVVEINVKDLELPKENDFEFFKKMGMKPEFISDKKVREEYRRYLKPPYI